MVLSRNGGKLAEDTCAIKETITSKRSSADFLDYFRGGFHVTSLTQDIITPLFEHILTRDRAIIPIIAPSLGA